MVQVARIRMQGHLGTLQSRHSVVQESKNLGDGRKQRFRNVFRKSVRDRYYAVRVN